MLFGEYELSPGLIGLSLLPTAHPDTFQCISVGPSTECYFRFSRAMGRSLRLRVCRVRLVAQLRLAFASAPRLRRLTSPYASNSLAH